MKKCPQCDREYDNTMSFCLDDGTELLYGPASMEEPATAILSEPPASDYPSRQTPPSGGPIAGGQLSESPTRSQLHTTAAEAEPQQDFSRQSERQSLSANRAARPLAALALALAVLIVAGGLFGYRYFSASSKQIESIAVMPFVNESGNADVEYLSDGMAETLINSLSKLANLSVKARNAVFRYKGKEVSARQIGDELGVQAVLLGRLIERGGNIKLNLELVNAKTLDVIWSEQYYRKQGDLVNLQQEIARDVSSKLRLKLTGADEQKLAKSYTADSEAYRLYLQARFYLNKRVGKEYEKAEGYLLRAIAQDPNLALGWVGLAEFVSGNPSRQDRTKAKEYIARALAIDSELSEARAALGFQFVLDYNWPAAERELSRALEIDPNSVRANQWNGDRLMMIGRYDECLAAYDRAIAIEPTLADLRNNRAACLVAAGRLDEGITEIKKAMEIDPSYAWLYSHISFLYRMKGDQAASVEARARSAELVDRPELAARLREIYRTKGWSAYLRELFDQTRDLFPNLVRRASILSEFGEKEEAIALLTESAAKGEFWLFSIKYDPAFDPLRGDPRFQALLKKFDPPR